MAFIVIEGLDGSGKSTQVNKILDYLQRKELRYKYVHFPRLEKGIYGDLVARFLRGELGNLEDVHPYLVALIYAGDRKDAAEEIREWLQKGFLVLVDRYVCSNIAYQGAKLHTMEEKHKLAEWINELEYRHNGIPRPDLNIFLDVPFSFTQKKLSENREGTDREYLKGKEDIHESNLGFQRKVKEMYLWQAHEYPDFEIINCKGNDNEMLSPEKIFDRIIKSIKLIPEIKNL
jgi:dTMP kinase